MAKIVIIIGWLAKSSSAEIGVNGISNIEQKNRVHQRQHHVASALASIWRRRRRRNKYFGEKIASASNHQKAKRKRKSQ